MIVLAAIVVVTNIGFVAAFDTDLKCPSWVAYDIDPSKIVRAERAPIQFRPDPRIPGTDLATFYRGAYDRGHMAPAADFNWDENALRQTYYFSNIAPQVPSVNRGEWRLIEKHIRHLASSGLVHVVTIPVFTNTTSIDVSVPSSFYKVAYGSFGARVWFVENKGLDEK